MIKRVLAVAKGLMRCRAIVRLPPDIAIWDRGNTLGLTRIQPLFDKSASSRRNTSRLR
jgi:hypothetical protein